MLEVAVNAMEKLVGSMKDAPSEARINVADWEGDPYMWVIYPKYSTVLGRMSTAVFGRPVTELV